MGRPPPMRRADRRSAIAGRLVALALACAFVLASPPSAVAAAFDLEALCREAPYNWFNFYDFWADAETSPAADAAR